MELRSINMTELRDILKRMKPTKSTGTDTINMKIIKLIEKTLEPAILNIINTSITTNTYPDNLKIQKILPTLKSGKDETQPLSFRPINILQSFSKIIEYAVMDQTKEHLYNNNLIPSEHSGGLKGNSTTTVAIQLIDQWAQILENNENVVNLQLDQTGAFEVVDHNLLLKK